MKTNLNMTTKGYVYLICDPINEQYKIGVTKGTIERRIKKLQTGNSTELHVTSYYHTEYPFKLEAMLHAKYRCKNTLNEWFALSHDEVISFKKTCDELCDTINTLSDNPFFVRKGLK